MRISNFKELNNYLRQFKAGSITDDHVYTLDRMKSLMPLLGSPQEKMHVIHVAGTSGKTSTCYYISELLITSGAKVGLTVSPHVFEINERVQVDGVPLAEDTMCQLFSEFITIDGVLELKPTYFELLVAFAFWVFCKLGCTHAVIEVGLGGLLDGTNIIENPSKVSVITDIGLDHMHILGKSIPEIAAQKAGIIQRGNQVFSYTQGKEVDDVISAQANKQRAYVTFVDQPELEHNKDFRSELPLYQKRNWLLAEVVADYVIKRDGLKQLSRAEQMITQRISMPGRMQHIQLGKKLLVLDGAHNPQKLQAFVYSLTAMYPGWRAAILAAFIESKRETLLRSLELLKNISNNIITTEFVGDMDLPHKVIPAHELANYCDQAKFKRVDANPDPKAALRKLLQQPEDILVITGSFYLIGSLWPEIKEYIA
jgi:dihydrofolate synthase/folylpolyglutamate synthase